RPRAHRGHGGGRLLQQVAQLLHWYRFWESEAAAAAARATGDLVLISGSLDLFTTVSLRAGRSRQAHRLARERLAMLDSVDRHAPSAAAEILDAFPAAWLSALAAGDLPAALPHRADDRAG